MFYSKLLFSRQVLQFLLQDVLSSCCCGSLHSRNARLLGPQKTKNKKIEPMVEVFMDLQTWRQIKTSGLSGCAMTKWLLYSCYSLQCTKSEPMSYLAVWKSLKQFRDFVRHRWILHFSQNMRLFLVHPSILHRFSVLSSCRGQCPTWSYLTS